MSSRMGWPPLQGGGHSHATRRGVKTHAARRKKRAERARTSFPSFSSSTASPRSKCAWKLQPRQPSGGLEPSTLAILPLTTEILRLRLAIAASATIVPR
jgi:hypothetical protein